MFLFSRLVDIALKSCELQHVAIFPSHLVIDPVLLSVTHLKRVLDNRGISYAGFFEKQELRSLVEASGDLSEAEFQDFELETSAEGVDNEAEITKFSCGAHFYELVEDTKDSAWLILVKPFDGSFVEPSSWRGIANKAANFGIRTATFDCALDRAMCNSKQWTSSRLLLAMPRDGRKAKDDVILKQYLVGHKLQHHGIFKWIHEQLASRVHHINSIEELNQNWLANNSSSKAFTSDIKFILISSLATPPLILSALAMKFNGRITFGMFRADNEGKSTNGMISKKLPIYVISLGDQTLYYYGNKSGESFKYRNMELLLRTLKPEMNDVFLLSLFIVNAVVCLNFCWMKCSRFWKHLVYGFVCFVKYNCVLFLVWLAILALAGSRFPSTDRALSWGLKACQYLATSSFASLVRHDSVFYKSHILIAAFVACGTCLAFIRRKLVTPPDDNDDESLFRDWAPWESTILSYFLFRPMGISSLRPVASSIEANLEEGMELLIERLAVPNLWLQADFISCEYIKDLPVWQYLDENEEDTSSDSNGEETATCESSEEQTAESCAIPAATFSPAASHASTSSSLPLDDPECLQCSSSPRVHKRAAREGAHPAKTSASAKHLEPKERKARRDVSVESAPESMLLCKECAICLDTYRRQQLICGLPCGHNYHESCIMSWLFRDNHCCPKCRWPTYKQKPKVC